MGRRIIKNNSGKERRERLERRNPVVAQEFYDWLKDNNCELLADEPEYYIWNQDGFCTTYSRASHRVVCYYQGHAHEHQEWCSIKEFDHLKEVLEWIEGMQDMEITNKSNYNGIFDT